MLKAHIPLIGIVAALCLFYVAAGYYPGGTTVSASSVGYSWTDNFISTLFARRALNGAPNPAIFIAIPAMLVLCASIGLLFKSISNKAVDKGHRKAIEIGGIGSMVYAFLAVTPMHDLMINIALPFALIALIATLHVLYVKKELLLFACGVICVALLLLAAAVYYGNVLLGFLPAMQKVSLVACVCWLAAIHYASFGHEGQKHLAPNKTIEPTR